MKAYTLRRARSRRFCPRLGHGAALTVLLAAGLLFRTALSSAADGPRQIEISMPPVGSVQWNRGDTPVLVVDTLGGDGWITLSRRYSGSSAAASAIKKANPRLRRPLRDRPVQVPVEVLHDDLRLTAVGKLFPADSRVREGWRHWVLDPFGGGEESWEWLADLFCGARDKAQLLRSANPELASRGLVRGRIVFVPEKQLLPVFRRIEAPPEEVEPTPTSVVIGTVKPTPTNQVGRRETPLTPAGQGPLSYGSDAVGDYAVYRLRKGEALYSAVVVRFTGQLHAVQVNATAVEIAERSGIKDVTSIPIGYAIKIPLDLLLPEHLPPDHPRRRAWEQEERELGRFLELVRATDLSGVHVILDAGHGGNDTGAVVNGVWEAAYAYDIMCRIKENLERHTRATVWTTIKDRSRAFSILPQDRLPLDRDQVLLSRPPYDLSDTTIGVHLRWYLANDIILHRTPPNVPRSKTVFLTIHADSLHPSVRGAMAYVPSRSLRCDSYSVGLRAIRGFAEHRNNPTVKLSEDFKARAEASSRHLASRILASVQRNGINVHPYEPVRDRVLRGRRSWVPAVLRYSLAQNAVLLECCNMSNDEDRKALLRSQWREELARAVVEGIADAFRGH
jgi:N-acetylmuramoyl-L-alanine amidase